MCYFTAHEHSAPGDITVNAKSLMGLLSLGLRDGRGATIIAIGEDEAQAACAIADILQNS